MTRLQIMAMDTLQLAHNATLIEIKARYKELVKRFHPDANGGDRGAEERLKQVIKAYGVLRASGPDLDGLAAPSPHAAVISASRVLSRIKTS